jgi:hypothetical protein
VPGKFEAQITFWCGSNEVGAVLRLPGLRAADIHTLLTLYLDLSRRRERG